MFKHLVPSALTLALAVLLGGLAAPVLPSPPPTAAALDKVEPGLWAQLEGAGQATFLVVLAEQADLRPAYRMRDWERRGRFVLQALREAADRSQPPVLDALAGLQRAGHVSQVRPHYILNLVVVRGDRAALQALSGLPAVAAIYADVPIVPVAPLESGPAPDAPAAPEWNLNMIHAPEVWATYRVNGQGIVVANIDSGVDYDHPALVEQYRGNLGGGDLEHNYNWWDPSGQYDYPAPIQGPYPLDSSHGTHTMGIMVGDDGAGNQIGVAPGARWIAAYGFSGLDGLLSATEWMIAPTDLNGENPDPDKRPHVVNNSWGAPGGFMLFNDLLRVQRAAGILATFAAGNNGYDVGSGGYRCGTLVSPADNPAGLAVGATTIADSIAPFSSRGPNALQPWLDRYATGPDVSAPGMNIRSSHPGGSYSSGSGTSYASPHIAGVAALLWSAEPDLVGQVTETLAILRGTAAPRTNGESCGGVPGSQVPNNAFGWGRVDALAAVDMVWQAGVLSGTVREAGSGAALPAAEILLQRSGHTLRTRADGAGHYRFPLGQGSYTVTVRAYGYQTRTISGVQVLQDLTSTLPITLLTRPSYTLSGQVSEAGAPVRAHLGLADTPLLMDTDPASGIYSASVAAGDYLLRATARGYLPQERTVTVGSAQEEDFALAPRWTYYARDSRSACGPAFDWIDATDGSPHYLDFQDFATIYEPGVPFRFYGQSYDLFYVSSNGFLSFEQGYPDHVQDLPTVVIPFEGPANQAIYGFGEMFNPENGAQGTVYHKVVDGRYLVVEFHQVEHWVSGEPETFEFVLDSQTGAILLQYQQVSRPDWAVVGLENADGSDGLAYSQANSAQISDSLAVGFYPIFGPPPAEQDAAGVRGSLSGTVYISGTGIPVPHAAVTASSFLQTLSTTADGAGRYRFADVCADRYTLRAGAPGYAPGPAVEARLRWAGDAAVQDLLLIGEVAGPVLAKTVWPTQVRYGRPLTYTISLHNGGGDLLGATLRDPLPGMVGYLTSSPPGVYREHILSWTVDLEAGASSEFTIQGFLIPPPGSRAAITNSASLLWAGSVVSDSAAFEPLWTPWPPPALDKLALPAQVHPGELVSYSLSYENGSGVEFEGAVLRDLLPAEVEYITSSPPGGYRQGVLSWTLSIPAYASGVVTVVGRLDPGTISGTLVSNEAYLDWWPGQEPVSASAALRVIEGPCQAVQGPAIAWAPVQPLVGQAVRFSATVEAGDPPITYSWRFGDGGAGLGATAVYSYSQAGRYTVALTAANCGGGGLAVARVTVEVVGSYRYYLPLIRR